MSFKIGVLSIIIVLTITGIYMIQISKKENFAQDFNWQEYGRVERNELSFDFSINRDSSIVYAIIIFKNISSRPLNVFTFNLQSNLALFLDGQKLKYLGRYISMPPSKNLYTTILPGQKLEIKVNLTESYGISQDSVGELTIRYNISELDSVEKKINL